MQPAGTYIMICVSALFSFKIKSLNTEPELKKDHLGPTN